MAKSQLKTTLPWDVQKVWQMVTDAEGYSWRSDLSRVEVLDGTRFIEYGTDGTATAFTVTRSEPYHRWEFDIENNNMKGHWIGIFTPEDHGTAIEFIEEMMVKKFGLRPLIKAYLRKQQTRFVADLKAALEQGDDISCAQF